MLSTLNYMWIHTIFNKSISDFLQQDGFCTLCRTKNSCIFQTKICGEVPHHFLHICISDLIELDDISHFEKLPSIKSSHKVLWKFYHHEFCWIHKCLCREEVFHIHNDLINPCGRKKEYVFHTELFPQYRTCFWFSSTRLIPNLKMLLCLQPKHPYMVLWNSTVLNFVEC